MRPIVGEERTRLMADIATIIEADTQIIGAPERTQAWETGWKEALEKFRAMPQEHSLIPAFIRDRPVRIKGEFYDAPGAELAHCRKMQDALAGMLADCPQIAEFGSGTCFNLVALGRRFKHTLLHAFDFSPSAVELAELIRKEMNLNIYGHLFDMRNPPNDTACQGGFGIFTFGAVEQLAGDFKPFIEYLIRQSPRIVIHIEPTVELYDETNEVDALAIRFHRRRGYTEGLLPYLQSRVNVIHVERSEFGSLMHSGYSQIVWKP